MHILRIIFGEILLRVENLRLPAPYFRIFTWHLIAPYSLAPRATARLARPLDRPWSDVPILCADYHIALSLSLCVISSNLSLQLGHPNLFVIRFRICLTPVQSALLQLSEKRIRHCYQKSTFTRNYCYSLSLHIVRKNWYFSCSVSGPWSLPKRVRKRGRSSASSFSFQYLHVSLRLSNSSVCYFHSGTLFYLTIMVFTSCRLFYC
jgi:hypothetical protein